MMPSRYRSFVTLLLGLGLLAMLVAATGTPVAGGVTQTMLDTTGLENETLALAVNARGKIAGVSFDRQSGVFHAVAWDTDGTPRRLPAPEGWAAMGLDINDRGEIAGAIIDEAGYSAPVVWSDTGMTRLPIRDAEFGVALALNNRGDVIGSLASEDSKEVYVLWSGEEIIDITAPKSLIWTQVTGINDDGMIVGSAGTSSLDTTAATWQDGVFAWLPDLATRGGESIAWAINEAGVIAGVSEDDEQLDRAVIWVNGQPAELETPDGFETSEATGINDTHLVVGEATRPSGMPQPVAWSDGEATLLPTRLPGSAIDINENGLVVGRVLDGEAAIPCTWTLHQEPAQESSSATAITGHAPASLTFSSCFLPGTRPLAQRADDHAGIWVRHMTGAHHACASTATTSTVPSNNGHGPRQCNPGRDLPHRPHRPGHGDLDHWP